MKNKINHVQNHQIRYSRKRKSSVNFPFLTKKFSKKGIEKFVLMMKISEILVTIFIILTGILVK
jgi:hypothetical protein